MPFITKGKTNWNFLVIVIVLSVIIGGGTLYFATKQETLPTQLIKIKQPIEEERTKPKEEKPAISIEEVQSTLTSLINNLKETIETVNQGNISLVSTSLENYQNKLIDFNLKSSQIEIEKITDKNLLINLRHNEWENYKLFLELKQKVVSYSQLSDKISDIENLIEKYFKTQTIEATKILLMPQLRETSYFNRELFLASLRRLINISTVQASSDKGVIHKKVIIDPTYAKENSTMLVIQPCWTYESWIDLENNRYRQELHVTSSRPPGFEYTVEFTDEVGNIKKVVNYCDVEIDITDVITGKKLALDPYSKTAEWLDPTKGKHGIGEEITKDPYTIFKTNLEKEECNFDGTDIFEEREVYKVKCPIFDIGYRLYYIDAYTYLPIEELNFQKSWQEGEIELYIAYKYVIGEIIEMESLPEDLFELKIPPDYELQEWSPFG